MVKTGIRFIIGINPIISIILGLVIAYGVIQKFGEKVELIDVIEEKKASNQ